MFANMPPEEQRRNLLEVIPERYIEADIKDLRPALQEAFAQDHDTGIVLWGEEGRGKTYAMAVLAKQYITEGFIARRIHYKKLCLTLQDTCSPKATQTMWDLLEPLIECDKLFIEDVGTGKRIGNQQTDFSLGILVLLLDMRLECMRPTFITTNLSVENLGASFDRRTSDRLGMFNVFQLTGKSRRQNV